MKEEREEVEKPPKYDIWICELVCSSSIMIHTTANCQKSRACGEEWMDYDCDCD